MSETGIPILVSVVIVNYNCKAWVPRCLQSLREQTIYNRLEIIFTDNISHDGSDVQAQELMQDWPHAVFIQTGANLGFSGGANRGAASAKGKYLFFLNPDVWIERECLERLAAAAEANGFGVIGPTVMDYQDDSLQSKGAVGFDIFGMNVERTLSEATPRLFAPTSFFLSAATCSKKSVAGTTIFSCMARKRTSPGASGLPEET